MSNWTHVAAIVRVDGLDIDLDKLATYVFGKHCDFYDDMSVWNDQANNPENYLYMGSEGSLDMSVWKEPNKDCLCAGTISIFGDLRDTDSAENVVEWFKKCLEKLSIENEDVPAWVRQATITADNEWNGTVNWTYIRKDD